MNTVSAVVSNIEPLTHFVFKIELQLQQPIDFAAGQYLMLHLSDDDKRPFSIACGPDSNKVELHIGASGADDWAMQAIRHLQENDKVTISLPYGDAYLREDSLRPIILVAGGTGFTYVNSILERLHALNSGRKVKLYWGVKTENDAYAAKRLEQLAQQWGDFEFHKVIEKPDAAFGGRTGFVHRAVLDDISELNAFDIYIAGRFEMVGIVRDDFVAKGADPAHIYGDALAFLD